MRDVPPDRFDDYSYFNRSFNLIIQLIVYRMIRPDHIEYDDLFYTYDLIIFTRIDDSFYLSRHIA